MPYEISFTKPVEVSDPGIYINECCWGGDIVRDQLLPQVAHTYKDLRTAQEDWGWFIWFRSDSIFLAIDICCDDPQRGNFRIRLTSHREKGWFGKAIVDTPELEQLRELVCAEIARWAVDFRCERED